MEVFDSLKYSSMKMH